VKGPVCVDGVEPANEPVDPPPVTTDEDPILKPVDVDGLVVGDDVVVVPASTGTWSFLGNENCYDICGSGCSIFCP